MQNSSIEHLWKGIMSCEWLKYVDLSHSPNLREIPDFSTAVHLEELDLRKCESLIKVHDSVGSLENLVILRLDFCSSLEQLPRFLKLKSLEYLGIPYCKILRRFPGISEEMNSLKTIFLCGSGIDELPESIEYLSGLENLYLDVCIGLETLPNTIYRLRNLQVLNMRRCSNFHTFPYKWEENSITKSSSPSPSSSKILHSKPISTLCLRLTHLNLESCKISNTYFIETLSKFAPSLHYLNLSENSFYSIPSCIVNFTSLRYFVVQDNKFLQEIPKVPTCVYSMDAKGCDSLARFPDNIADMISSNPEEFEEHGDYKKYYRELTLMNSDIPKWYYHSERVRMKSYSRICVLHNFSGRKLRALAPCIVFKVDERCPDLECQIFVDGTMIFRSCRKFFNASPFEYMWLLVINPPPTGHSCPHIDKYFWEVSENYLSRDWNEFMDSGWNVITLTFEFIGTNKGHIRSCGLHVVEEEM